MDKPLLQIKGIKKSFGDVCVLQGIDLDINKGEFITLLGSSGCGKTTTLRIIAGLEQADQGQVLLNGEDVTRLEPNKRDVNTVFQNYALFPHMTVEENIGYGLKLKKKSKQEIKEAVGRTLEQVRLEGFGERYSSELSGGQRQRVAIARAIVNNPSVLLLDEPLGALDLQLRRQMQLELKRLQKQLGITFIYITHDQEEALNMSDRICVMKDGNFIQIGTPAEIYDAPKTAFVARFVGEANILQGTVEQQYDGKISVSIAGGVMEAADNGFSYPIGEKATIAIRSERVDFSTSGQGIPGIVKEKTFSGGMLRIGLELSDGKELIASRHGIDVDVHVGETIFVSWICEDALAVQAEVDA